VWRPALKAAGANGVTFHEVRHSYASVLIRAGLSVRLVADRLGHADASMTLNMYAHLCRDDEDRTRSAVDSLFGAPAEQVRTDDRPHPLSPAAMPLIRRSAGTPG
jgi:integrase